MSDKYETVRNRDGSDLSIVGTDGRSGYLKVGAYTSLLLGRRIIERKGDELRKEAPLPREGAGGIGALPGARK